MLELYGDQTVCFGLSRRRGRLPLGIAQLVGIKRDLLKELEGIQMLR